jgi:hypothetical protein
MQTKEKIHMFEQDQTQGQGSMGSDTEMTQEEQSYRQQQPQEYQEDTSNIPGSMGAGTDMTQEEQQEYGSQS